MIPTSVTSSSPPTAAVGGGGSLGAVVNNSPIIPSANGCSNGGQGNNIALLGIASLILEGRALSEDEYAIPTACSNFTATLNRNTAECGRQSPKPSTSRAAFEHFECISNTSYLRRMVSNSPDSMSSSSFLRDYYSSGSESASSSVESNHSRWSQKLSQLRQESPSAHHHVLAAREKVAVECPRSTDAEYVALAINTNLHGNNEERRGDFEIRRRIALNRMNLYNSPASTGSGSSGASGFGSGSSGGYTENFMCSLQSLASNTCLRAGNPLLPTIAPTSTPIYPSNRPRLPTPQQIDQSPGMANSFDSGVQSPGYSPHLGGNNNNNKDYHKTSSTQWITIPSAQQTSTITTSTPIYNFHSNVFATATAIMATPTTSRNNQIHPQQGPHCDQFLKKMGLAKGDASETEEHHCDMSYVNTTCTRWRAYCNKIENILARGEPVCIEVYLGPVGHKMLLEQWIITQKERQPPPTMTLPSLCSAIRSQLYFSQISAWCDLIKKSDKTIYETGRLIFNTPSTTTTSAAGDLATKNHAMSTSPTTQTPTTATTSTTSTATPLLAMSFPAIGSGSTLASSSGNGAVVGCAKRRSARLNIFYRIKQYDSTACFNSKPNVHNFPNVNISENCTVSVCLKSLPRSKGGIPKIGTSTSTSTPTQKQQQQQQQQQQPQHNTAKSWATAIATATSTATETPTLTTPKLTLADLAATLATTSYLAAKSATAATAATINANKPTILTMNCDNNLKKHHQQQKTITATPIASTSSASASASASSSNSAKNENAKSKETSSLNIDHEDPLNEEFESEQNVDLNAGGDSNISNCSLSGVGGTGSVCDGDSSNSSFSTNYCGNLSHREKQLLKYRKRMLKRDKKQHQRNHNEINNFQTTETETDNSNNKMEQGEDDNAVNVVKDGWQYEKEEEEEQEEEMEKKTKNEQDVESDVDKNHHNIVKGQRQRLPNNHINSIPSTNHHHHHQQQQQQPHVKMISTGTQTNANTCTSCGSDKSMICLKCYPSKNYASTSCSYEEMEAEFSSASSLSSSDIIHTPRNKAELLLQAIQRTPKSNKKHKKSKDLQQMAAIKQSTTTATKTNNNHARYGLNHFSGMNGNNGAGMVGCQVCKRQKTQHIFSQPPLEDFSSSEDNSPALNTSCNNSNENKSSDVCDDEADGEGDNDTDGGKMSSSDCVDNVSAALVVVVDDGVVTDCVAKVSPAKPCDNSNNDNEIMEEEYFESSTKLTPHIDRCSLNTKAYNAQMQQRSTKNDRAESHRRSCSTPPLDSQIDDKCPNKGGSSIMAQFKTPTPSEQHSSFKIKATQPVQPHKHTPKPNLLQIACNFNKNEDQLCKTNHSKTNETPPTTHNPLLVRRSLPKVNLTPIFCNPSSMMVISSPIPIGNGVCNGSSKTADINLIQASPTFSFESPSSPAPSLTVQKSNSAPTLPNSPSLSPRFVKSSTLNKRRSRHLSDRSDRSSLGSDEQFSDEDLDSGMYSPFATSPTKFRTRLAAVFGRKPLLGNLEENLLQRRLVPKIEVMGFKLLLGASGGFCPTQLTIPAAAYFYELKGDTLSTPYLCEIRLPRKGYTVPRYGTVQATLLNPMGTVVRMFVIPYDMRDMPTLHQTFVRQRILADIGLQQSNGSGMQDSGGVDKTVNDSGDNATINTKQQQQNQRSPQCNNEHNLGHFISAENMKSLRYSIHLRFQTSRTGRLMLHTDIRLLISRRTDCDTAAAHAKGVLEAPNELITNIVMPTNPKYSARQDQTSSKM